MGSARSNPSPTAPPSAPRGQRCAHLFSQPGRLALLLLAALVVEALHGSASTHLRSTSSSATMRGGLLALALGQALALASLLP